MQYSKAYFISPKIDGNSLIKPFHDVTKAHWLALMVSWKLNAIVEIPNLILFFVGFTIFPVEDFPKVKQNLLNYPFFFCQINTEIAQTRIYLRRKKRKLWLKFGKNLKKSTLDPLSTYFVAE